MLGRTNFSDQYEIKQHRGVIMGFNNLDKVRIKPNFKIKNKYWNKEGIILHWHLDETYSIYVKS